MDTRMLTTVTKRGQTVVPATIRKRYDIQVGDRLVWLDDGQVIKVIVIPADPISALKGIGRGEKMLDALLKARQEDRQNEP